MGYVLKKICEANVFMTGETYKTSDGKEVEILIINRNNSTALGKLNGYLIAMFHPRIIVADNENGEQCELLDYPQAIHLVNDENYYFDYLDKYATKDMSDTDCAYILKKQNFRIIITIYELIVARWKSHNF